MGILLFLWLISGCLLFMPFIFLLISNKKTKAIAAKYLDKVFAVLIGIFCAMGGIFLISKMYESIIGIVVGLLILLFGFSLIWVGTRMKTNSSSWDRWWQVKCESLDDEHK